MYFHPLASHYPIIRLIIKEVLFPSYRLEHPFLPSLLFNLFTRFPAIYFRPIFTRPPTHPSLLQINIYTCTFGPINHAGHTYNDCTRIFTPRMCIISRWRDEIQSACPSPTSFPLTPLSSRVFPRPFCNFHGRHVSTVEAKYCQQLSRRAFRIPRGVTVGMVFVKKIL